MVVARDGGLGVDKISEDGQKAQTSSYKSWGAMYIIVTTVNNTVYLKVAKRVV